VFSRIRSITIGEPRELEEVGDAEVDLEVCRRGSAGGGDGGRGDVDGGDVGAVLGEQAGLVTAAAADDQGSQAARGVGGEAEGERRGRAAELPAAAVLAVDVVPEGGVGGGEAGRVGAAGVQLADDRAGGGAELGEHVRKVR
jgi:hypothetical protein